MASDTPVVRVGVGVFVLKSVNEDARKNPSFLMGKRLNSHGAETWALPGGHLEWGESPEECAAREVLEETGLELTPHVKFLTATNDFMPADQKHYITMFTVSAREHSSAEPKPMEPEKCEGWEWVSWATLEELAKKQINGEKHERSLFTPLLSLIQQRPGVVPSLS
jgi:8-oxo-dGTP diphosphatase